MSDVAIAGCPQPCFEIDSQMPFEDRQLQSRIRVRAKDDAGKSTRLMFRPFAPWKPASKWGVPEPVMPLIVFVIGAGSIAVLAKFQGPWVVAVLLFSPMATSWIGVCVLLVIWGTRAWPRHLARSRATSLYREACCASCGYALPCSGQMSSAMSLAQHTQSEASTLDSQEKTSEERARFTVCPECGASWDMQEPGPTQWLRVTVTRDVHEPRAMS